MGWLDKVKDWAKGAYGKAKEGVAKVGRLFDKGKDIYGKAKNIAVNLPEVGGALGDIIAKGEGRAEGYAQQYTGKSLSELDTLQQKARNVVQALPSMN
jgi:hypothetical protein